MNKILPQKSFYSFIKGKIWTTTLAMLMLFMAIGTFKAHAQDQILCGPATVSNLINTGPSGSTASWFTDVSGGSALATSTAIATGTYYVEQSIPIGTATLGSGFRGPTGVAVQADGKIIVADLQNNLVKRMNADGTGIVTLGSGFFQPINVAVEASGTILILEFGPSAVKRMSADGTVITTVASGFNNPGGVTVQSDGKILVANSGAGTIIRMDADGSNLVTLGSGFNFPYATAVQSDGKIVFADAANSLIKRMDANGGNIVTLGNGFNNPRRVAIQPDGKILIADFGNSAIKRMNADGTGIVTLGSGFGNTFGVALESVGKILVADFSNNAIKRITEAYTTTRTAVNVIINTIAVPTRDMSITGTLCNGATIGTLISKFNNSANVSCYATETGGAPLSTTDLIAPVNANVPFYLTQTIDGCESARVLYNAVVNFITPPTAAANQSFCTGATIANLVATPGNSGNGNNAFITGWYTSSTDGTALPSTTVLTNGNYYVGQIHISGCTLERTMVTVNINNFSENVTTVFNCNSYTWANNGMTYSSSGVYSGTTTNCVAEKLDLTITNTPAPTGLLTQIYRGNVGLQELTVNGIAIKWYDSPINGTEISSLLFLVDGTTYYASQTLDGCESQTRLAVKVTEISEETQTFCGNATVADLVTNPSAGQTVQWYSDAAGTMPIFNTTQLSTGTYYVAQKTPAIVSTFAGTGAIGTANGSVETAQFNKPRDIVADTDGNFFITDYQNNKIRKISPSGLVSDFVNLPSTISFPHGISIDGFNNLYIGSSGNNKIIKVTPAGLATTFAGDGGQGAINGPANTAQFSNLSGVTFDNSGIVYVADSGNHSIRKISTTAEVTTIAGSSDGYTNAQGTAAQFSFPYDVTSDSFGNIYVADINNHLIRKITPTGDVTTFAGSTMGYEDGIGSTAKFNSPRGLAVDSGNNIYVMDAVNRRVRKISPSGNVTTIAGTGTTGFTDGAGNIAEFGIAWGLTVDANGIIYVADTNNNKIRKIIQSNEISNLVDVKVIITPITENITTISSCDSYTWVSNDSQTYNESGTYTGFSTNCVTEKLVLTIIPSSSNTTTVTAIGNYLWAVNGSTYNTNISNYDWAVGNCFTEFLNLTIIPATLSVTNENGVLTATTNAPNATYQWIDCISQQAIPNQTGATFTPTQSGSYLVNLVINNQVLNNSGCLPFTFLDNNTFSGIVGIDLYPNPSNGIFNFQLVNDLQIEVYNNLGQLLQSEKMFSGNNTINITDKAAGIYFLKANDGNNVSTYKIIKN